MNSTAATFMSRTIMPLLPALSPALQSRTSSPSEGDENGRGAEEIGAYGSRGLLGGARVHLPEL